MMAESEAKSKWCPFARVGVVSEVTGAAYAANRAGKEGKMIGAAMCLGSACMAWRCGGLPYGIQTVIATIAFNSETGATETLKEDPPRWGYCGLAGRP
jgi:hypothetical protein